MSKAEDTHSKVLELSAEKQEALFKALLDKIMGATDAHQLEECTLLALSLMLRRPSDKELLTSLRKQVVYALDELPKNHAGKFVATDIRPVAKRCVQILKSAKEKRLSRAQQEALGLVEPHVEGKKPRAQKPAKSASAASTAKLVWLAVSGVALVVAVGAIWKIYSGDGPVEPTPARLVEQIIEASEGNRTPVHVYGGPLIVEGGSSGMIVTALDLPPKICASAGWLLVRKGMLTINDTTPNRVSAIVVSELCNERETASISWSPKLKGQ
jgi:hypothetical protein